ncbi:hypothetical protein ACQP2P_32075 [Dactylosporangium sp. CA-139114]|uniref:hypothetical protein n=1 Tax=Dactylosporangium sp. CA-139114 TaxID=3239931 RepID=UPI003D97DE75
MAKYLQLVSHSRTVAAVFAAAFVLVVPLVQEQIAPPTGPVVSTASGADAPVVMQPAEIDWP